MSRRLTLTFALALAACGGKASSTSSTTPDPTTDTRDGDGGGGDASSTEEVTMTCATMGAALEENNAGDGMYSSSQMGQMRAQIVDECDAQGWSADALACFASVTGATAWASCEDGLPDDQRASLQQLSVGAIAGE